MVVDDRVCANRFRAVSRSRGAQREPIRSRRVTYQQDLQDYVFNKTPPTVMTAAAADEPAFFEELNKRLAAFVFIGHSVESPVSPNPSVGLQVSSSSRSAYQWLVKPGFCGVVCDAPKNFTIEGTIPSSATIIFVASCNDGDDFNAMWGSFPANGGRALIVPEFPVSVGLKAGAVRWKLILSKLLQGWNVFDAVTWANNQQVDTLGGLFEEKSFAPGSTFRVIGDNSAHIR